MSQDRTDRVVGYHESTKHHFHRFAPSLGMLDWATQPDPFRRYDGAELVDLPHRCAAPDVPYDTVYEGSAPEQPLGLPELGDFLRHALGLSAWKRQGPARWALRVNPSSGNLHPTEGHLVVPGPSALGDGVSVLHYRPDRHAVEVRAQLPARTWGELVGDVPPGSFLVALSSIPWREAWKYGERAFRYCQHDAGHALAALSVSASLLGWRASPLDSWSSGDLAILLGLDRTEARHQGEREEAELLLLVSPAASARPAARGPSPAARAALRSVAWRGRANRLSPGHVPWPAIDEVAELTRHDGAGAGDEAEPPESPRAPELRRGMDARPLVLRRRSALGLDGRSTLSRQAFERMLLRTLPGSHPPWDALGRPPRTHLALFVHRVDDLDPGMYALVRRPGALEELRTSTRAELEWAPASSDLPLYLLARGRCDDLAARLSCDQNIAGDGFFSLGMLAELELTLEERGPRAYRELFRETGVIGQVLYLEAEAAAARATGIGCFFDDPVHEALGLRGHRFQSLYHFTTGGPVDDPRLQTLPGYPDEHGA